MTNEKIQIEELEQKLSALKERRNTLNAEAREWAEKRDKLNDQVKNLRSEIRGLRSERDVLNEKVKECKQLREMTKTGIREKIEEIKKLSQQVRALTARKPPKSLQMLQKKLNEIEWEIQTTPLNLEEEKELVEEVGKLETQVNIHKEIKMALQRMLEVQTELKAAKTKNKLYHEKLTETAQRSQEIHNRMFEKINKLRELKIEADSMHQSLLKTRQKVKPVQNAITEILGRMELRRETIRKEEEEERKKTEETLKKKIEKNAREKLKRGEKLTWAEFQILTEKGKTTQD